MRRGELGHFGGIPIVESELCPPGTIYLLNTHTVVTAPCDPFGLLDDTIAPMPETKPFTQRVIDAIRRELVVLAPIALAIYSVWPEGVPVTSYKVWAPIVIGALLRQFVTTPAKEAEEKVVKASDEGFEEGVVLGKALASQAPPANPFPPDYEPPA